MKFSLSIAMAPPETPMVGGALQGRIDGLKRFADTVIAKMQ
jgi:hypothetical protein